MTKLYYRGMMGDNGKPKIGRHARCLGIRPQIDIDVELVPRNWIDDRGYLQSSSNRHPVNSDPLIPQSAESFRVDRSPSCNTSISSNSHHPWRFGNSTGTPEHRASR